MSSIQTTIPAAVGGFSRTSVPIPAGTCCARVQPTLADSDWSAGHKLTATVEVFLGDELIMTLLWQLETGALQCDPSAPLPSYGQLTQATAWPFDSCRVTLSCDSPSVAVGAIVSFADSAANMPAPVLPPGYVPGTKGGPS